MIVVNVPLRPKKVGAANNGCQSSQSGNTADLRSRAYRSRLPGCRRFRRSNRTRCADFDFRSGIDTNSPCSDRDYGSYRDKAAKPNIHNGSDINRSTQANCSRNSNIDTDPETYFNTDSDSSSDSSAHSPAYCYDSPDCDSHCRTTNSNANSDSYRVLRFHWQWQRRNSRF